MNENAIREFVRREVFCDEIFFDFMLKHGEIDYGEIENFDDSTEVFTWYRVSEFLYRDLKEKGEPVYQYGFHYFWGRTTFGQSIYMDGVIQEIYEDIFG